MGVFIFRVEEGAECEKIIIMKINRYDLIQLRNVGVITTPECMVILTFHFGDFQKMLREHSRKILRKLYMHGYNKIVKL